MDLWMDPPFNMIVSGQTNCGKTHSVLDLLETTYRGKFSTIVIFCPTFLENMTYNRPFVLKDPNIIVLPPDMVENNLDVMLSLCAKVYGSPAQAHNTLFLIDDCANLRDTKTKSSELTKLAFSGRHLNISVWCLTQKYNAVVKDFRENLRMLILYHQKDEDGLRDALRENNIVPKEERDSVVSDLKDRKRANLVMRLEFPYKYAIFSGLL